MRDFTLSSYKNLLHSFLQAGYKITSFEQYLDSRPAGKVLVLRHDVDLRPYNSVATADIEHSLGITASYYFRIVKASNVPDAIRRIVSLGHEIGYHYEDMALCNGDKVKAISNFEANLEYFRSFYPVRTICMHGVPTNRYDGRDLWRDSNGYKNQGGRYDYRSYGIIGEPYFDIDFNSVFYLTDTGCRWDGFRVSLRDKVPQQDEWVRKGWVYHSSWDIARAVKAAEPPFDGAVMMTTHPQRWTDQSLPWLKEQSVQRVKNIIKRAMIWAGGL